MTSHQIKKALSEALNIPLTGLTVVTQDMRVGEATNIRKVVVVNFNGREFPNWLRTLALQHFETNELVSFTHLVLFKEHWEALLISPEFLRVQEMNLQEQILERPEPRGLSSFRRMEQATTTYSPFEINVSDIDDAYDVATPVAQNPLANLANTLRRGRPSVYANCIRCADRGRKNDYIQVSLDVYACENCISYFQSCKHCTKYFLTTMEGAITNNGDFYCGDCKSHVWHCRACDEFYETSVHYIRVNSNTYCERCAGSNLFSCNECNELEEIMNQYRCGTCGHDFCHNCQRGHRNDCGYRELVEPYQFMEGKKENSQLPFERFVGVEIEAERGELNKITKKLPKYVGIVRDGSLHDRGVEIVTPPANYDTLENIIREVTVVLKSNGFKGTSNCGLHLHYDARDIMKDHTKIVQVIKTFFAMEDLLYSMLPPSRWVPEDGRKNYCQRLSEDYLFKSFRKKINKNDFEKEWYKVSTMRQVNNRKQHKYDESRYYGLNVHSIFYRGTIELRYHSGTIEDRKIINWINITSRMVNYAIYRYDAKEVEWFFNQETNYEKYKKFAALMGFNNKLSQYMIDRINKFNPDFGVKFNLGKVKRAQERRELALKQRKVNKIILEMYPEALKKIKADARLREVVGRTRLKQQALMLAKEMARNRLSRDLFNLPVDGGFANKEQLNMIKYYMDRGRMLASDAPEGADEGGL